MKSSLSTSSHVYIYSVNSLYLQINLIKAGIGQPKYRLKIHFCVVFISRAVNINVAVYAEA